MTDKSQHMIVAISGASGVIYGIRLLEILRQLHITTHLVISEAAEVTIAYETDLKIKEVKNLADHCYRPNDFTAGIASGSFVTMGMVIAPCSARLLCSIASGVGDNLLSRAADVVLKERRRLVMLVRETPLNLVHIRAMQTVTEMGGIIAPPVPAFYNKPLSLTDIVNHTLGRVLDLFDLDADIVKRWG